MKQLLSLATIAALLLSACSGEESPSEVRGDHKSPTVAPLALKELYTQGAELFAEPTIDLRDLWQDVVKNGWNESHPELELFIEEHGELLEFLNARTGSAAYFEEPSHIGGGGHSFDLVASMRYARLMILAGRNLARQRKDDAALDQYLAAMRFGHRHIHESDTPLITTLAGWSIQRETIPAIQDLVHRSRTSEQSWRKAIAEMQTLRRAWRPLPEACEDDQRLMANLLREEARKQGESEAFVDTYDELYEDYATGFAGAWESNEPERFKALIDALGKQNASASGYFSALFSEQAELELQVKTVLHLTMKDRGTTIELDMIKRMELDMLTVAIAVRMYYVDNARSVPEDLDQLIPEYIAELPVDLFARGEPIRLARSGANWWLYSIGPDRVDQDGMEAYAPYTSKVGGDVLSVAEHRGAHN